MPKPKRERSAGADGVRVECFLLCDYVRFENGKLDILGGGWDQIRPTVLPSPYLFNIALKLALPARYAGRRFEMRFEIADDAGRVIEPEGSAIGVELELRAEGAESVVDEIPFVFPLRMSLTVVSAGIYTLRLIFDGDSIARTAFRVAEPIAYPIEAGPIGAVEELNPPVSGPEDLLGREQSRTDPP